MGQAKLYGQKQQGVNIDGLVEDYYVYAGENISAGDFVEFVRGVASRTESSSNLAWFANSEVRYITTCLIDDNRFLIAYCLYSDEYLYVRVGTIENATITFSNAYNACTRPTELSSIIKVSDGKFLIAYAGYQSKWNIYTVLCTVSANNEITFGTDYTVQSGTSANYCNSPILKLISSTKALIVFKYGSTLYACVLSLNSTGVSSKGTLYSLTSDYGNSNAYSCGVSVCQLTETSFYAAFLIKTSSNIFRIHNRVLQISGSNITLSAEANFQSLSTDTNNSLTKIATCALSSTKVLVVFSNYASFAISSKVLNIEDGAVSYYSAAQTLFTQTSDLPNHFDVCKITEDKCILVTGLTTSPYTEGEVATIKFRYSGQATYAYIPAGSIVPVLSGATDKNVKYPSLFLVSNNKVIVSYTYDDHYGYSQAFNCSEDRPIKIFYSYTYETQVRKVTTSQFDGIAQTSGSGGTATAHNEQVSVLISALPNAYQLIEYIENTYQQYIDTGVVPDNNTDIGIIASDVNENSAQIFVSGGNYRIAKFTVTRLVGATIGGTAITSTLDGSSKFKAEIINKTLYMNNEVIGSSTDNIQTSYTLEIFRGNYGTIQYHSKFKCYGAYIKQNGVLVRNMIPCYRKSDGEIGMYDLVNNVFYSNAGVGTFTAGDKQENIITVAKPIEQHDNVSSNYISTYNEVVTTSDNNTFIAKEE